MPRPTRQLASVPVVLLLSVTAACALGRTSEPYLAFAGPPVRRQLGLRLFPPQQLVVGDRVRLWVERGDCLNDVCGDMPLLQPLPWSVEPNSLATIDEWGRLAALEPGTITVRVEKGDTVLSRGIEILPPVARIAWEHDSIVVQVDDTVGVRALAYDDTDAVVGTVITVRLFDAFFVFRVVARDPDGTFRLLASAPGTGTIRATLNERSTDMHVTVVPRPNAPTRSWVIHRRRYRER